TISLNTTSRLAVNPSMEARMPHPCGIRSVCGNPEARANLSPGAGCYAFATQAAVMLRPECTRLELASEIEAQFHCNTGFFFRLARVGHRGDVQVHTKG